MKGPYSIPGGRIDLREFRTSDVGPRYLGWLRDPEVFRFIESNRTGITEEGVRSYVADVLASPDSVFLAIVRKSDQLHIGNLRIGPINPVHRFASVGMLIGEKSCWGQGYASEAIALATRFAFDTLDLRRLEAASLSVNKGSTKAFLKAGWTYDGLERRKWLFEGQFVDGDRLCVLRE